MRISSLTTGVALAVSAAVAAVAPAVAGSPASFAVGPPPSCTVTGTAGTDVLRGTEAADVLCALAGRDVLLGRAGHDVLYGGPGKDHLSGGAGDDLLKGGPDDDVLVDRSGSDVLDGGPGDRDRCFGGAAARYIGCEITPVRSDVPRDPPATLDRRVVPNPSGAEPHFVPGASSVTLRGDDVVVQFDEVGLEPGASATLEVSATRTVRITCVIPGTGAVALDMSSSAIAAETEVYTADAEGRISATRVLSAAPGHVDIEGSKCTTRDRATVTIRDLTNEVELTLTA